MTQRAETSAAWAPLLTGVGLADLTTLLDAGLRGPAAAGQWTSLDKPGLGDRKRWRWELESDGKRATLYVKSYAGATWSMQLDRMRRQGFWHSRAWWEYRQALALQAVHIPVPAAVAYVEEMTGAIERRSAVLLANVGGDGLDRVWTRLAAERAPATLGLARLDLVRRVARFIAAFHQTGFCHRDLYLCHVFADVDPQGARPPRFWLIDLARTHRPRWNRTRWLIKDLSQLDSSARQCGATRADRLRFLQAYLGLQTGSARVRWYAQRIRRKSDHILRRAARKARAPR